MRISSKLLATLFLLLSLTNLATAQSSKTEHTYTLDDPAQRPAASIDQVAWLVGDWTGQAFGKQFEEVWNPASNGSMVGMFKLMSDTAVDFYEIMLLVEVEGSLSLRVKHFTADFISWEDKEDFVDFKLVSIKPGEIHFSGISFYQDGPDKITAWLALHNDEGKVWEEKLTYQRRGTAE